MAAVNNGFTVISYSKTKGDRPKKFLHELLQFRIYYVSKSLQKINKLYNFEDHRF